MEKSRRRECKLPKGWTVEGYWIEIDRTIKEEPGVRILRYSEPYVCDNIKVGKVRWVSRGAKYLVAMPTEESARALQKKLNIIPSRLSLRQRVEAVAGDLRLSVRQAYKSERSTAGDAAVQLNNLIQATEYFSRHCKEENNIFVAWLYGAYRNREVLTKYIEQHGTEAAVSIRNPSGTSWRLTWFDPVKRERHQASMGDIFLAYPLNDKVKIGNVIEPDKRSIRSDSWRNHVIFQNTFMEVIDRAWK